MTPRTVIRGVLEGDHVDLPILAVLPPDDRDRLLRESRRRRFGRDEVLFHEGDPADTVHVVLSGRVAVRITTELGDRATLTVAGPGQSVGEMALVTAEPRRTTTVVALEPTETLVLARSGFEELRRTRPALDRFLVALLAARVERLSAHLVEALFLPVDKRVLRRLLAMVDEYGAGRAVPLTQDHLASLAGTTRSTANRALRAAEQRGYLRVERGRVVVLDVPALERAAR